MNGCKTLIYKDNSLVCPVPPEPYRLVADIDTALEQQVLDLAQRQRVPDIHHHREANDFGRTIEIAEGIFHPLRLAAR